MTVEKVKEAVGVFDSLENLDEAIRELEGSSFPRHSISVLGSRERVEEKFGAKSVNPKWLEDNPNAPRDISIRPEEKTIGASFIIGVPAYVFGCAAALMAHPASNIALFTAITAGSLIGAAIGGGAVFLIGQKLKKRIERQLQKGGLLLWVATPTIELEKIALKILRKYDAKHVHIHNIS